MQALNTPGTESFGAVVVMDEQIVDEGIDRSVNNHDPTSHGKIEATRLACSTLTYGRPHLVMSASLFGYEFLPDRLGNHSYGSVSSTNLV